MMPTHEFRFAVWGTLFIVILGAALQTWFLLSFDVALPWWTFAAFYVVDSFMGLVGVWCLAGLP